MKTNGIIAAMAALALTACSSGGEKKAGNGNERSLPDIGAMIGDAPGRIGVAVITSEGDTLTVNNDGGYPLMSVFKLHEALAVAHRLDSLGRGMDSIVAVARGELNPNTWSPMLEKYREGDLTLPVSELMEYALVYSDNNASNLLFEKIVSVEETDAFVRGVLGRDDFRLRYTEHEMQLDHARAYENRSTPLACAALINRVFTDSLVSEGKQTAIKSWLLACNTGLDRIGAPLKDEPEVMLGHRTGSGYRTADGLLVAHNDVGFVSLPDGRHYSIAVLVRDTPQTEEAAARVIARVSKGIYEWYNP